MLVFSISPIISQDVTCNGQVNVSVNISCDIDLSIDAFLEGNVTGNPDVMNGNYTYEIYNSTGTIATGDINGVLTGGTNLTNYVNSFVFYRIRLNGAAVSCTGTVLLEDKYKPVIDCTVCPVVNGTTPSDYNPECVLKCYDQPILQLRYHANLRDDIIEEDVEDFVDNYVTDNCDSWDYNYIQYYDVYTSLGNCEGTKLVRTWKVGYASAYNTIEYAECKREYFFEPIKLNQVREYPRDLSGQYLLEPIEGILLLPLSDINVSCSYNVTPADIAAYFDDAQTDDKDSDGNGLSPSEFDLDLIIENHEGIPYGFPHYYQYGRGSGDPHPQPVSTEVCNLVIGYTDTEIDVCGVGCPGNRKILREWTILDWCTSEFITYSQLIKAIDRTPPTLDVPAKVVSVNPWDCYSNIKLPAPEHIYDNCDYHPSYHIGYTGGIQVTGNAIDGYYLVNAPLGTHSIEYKSEDCCGNIGSQYVNITIVDDTPPVAISKERIVVNLSNGGNPYDIHQGFAKAYAYSFDNGSYDGCTDVRFEIRRDETCHNSDAYWGDFVTFCCEDLEGQAIKEIEVELRIIDEYGNENRVWSIVQLEDKGGTFPSPPDHMFLSCSDDINDFSVTGLPRFFGACGEAVVDCDVDEVIANTQPRELKLIDGVQINGVLQTAPAYNPSCGYGAIRRQFKDCGGGQQWFIITPLNSFDASSITFPNDVTYDCNDYDPEEPSWLENTCNLVGVSLESDTFIFEDNACLKILNHWSVINWCEYNPSDPNSPGKYDYTQVVKIVDTEDPVISTQDSVCYQVFEGCEGKGVVLTANGLDNGACSSDWLSWDVVVDLYSDWNIDYTYSADEPRFLPSGDPNPFHLNKNGNGEDLNIYLPDGIPGSDVWHRVAWRVFDGCGNSSSTMKYFQITDKKAPTPYCLNLSTAVMDNGSVELWAIDFDSGSFDNCTPDDELVFTFTDVFPPVRNDGEYDGSDDQWYDTTYWFYDSESIDVNTGMGEYKDLDEFGEEVHRWQPGLRSSGRIFTTDDIPANGLLELPIYVWDSKGLVDFCIVNLRIIDNNGGGMSRVAGTIQTADKRNIQNVTATISGSLNYIESMVSDVNGFYFDHTPMYSDYEVNAAKTDGLLDGVSTLDLVLMQRHILGQQFFDDPYQLIAADVNGDHVVTALDMLELRKAILGIIDEFPNNNSWMFMDEQSTIDINDPFSFDKSIVVNDLSQDMMNVNFTGVKVGDVNNSIDLSKKKDLRPSKNQDYDLMLDNRFVSKNEIIDLELSFDDQEISGLQFQLEFNNFEVVEVNSLSTLEENEFYLNNNKLNVSVVEELDNNRDLFLSLKLKALTDTRILDGIGLGVELTPEAYNLKKDSFYNINIKAETDTYSFRLYQNEPNPFQDFTVLKFELDEDADGQVLFYNLNGMVLKVIEDKFRKGVNTYILSKDDFNTNGVIYYKLKVGDNEEVKTMLSIK